ncbi:hypothetical protein GGI12_004019, partial [Dipsacomyces acuminosporus]
SFKQYKLAEKNQAEAQSLPPAQGSLEESVQDIKQSIFDLEGRLAFLQAEKKAIAEFLVSGKQELIELQMEQMDLK